MCWVALDRALRIARRRSLPAPVQQWQATRDEIHKEIHDGFWDPHRRTFVQYRGAGTVDAASLLMPLTGFLSPVEPRWLDTLQAIDRELVEDSLVYRYRTATPTTWGSTPRRWTARAGTWAISRRRSPTWGSSERRSASTRRCPPAISG